MAIDRIPGVGPQNTDIASAVVTAGTSAGFAATGPTTSQIAAAVPTLAQITSAVTSNAASAGVTMAAITSSIQANAASSGVTIAAITSAGNSAGWGTTGGDTWTVISSGNVNGASALNLTGLSGYKKYKLCMFQLDCGGNNLSHRGYINSGTTGNTYAFSGVEYSSSSPFVAGVNTAFGNNTMVFSANPPAAVHYLEVFIEGANLTGYKPVTLRISGYNASGVSRYTELYGGMSSTTAAINQIYVFVASSAWSTGLYTLYGVN